MDLATGECKTAKLFVGVLGASNLTYIEPVLSENPPTWIGCHINMFHTFGTRGTKLAFARNLQPEVIFSLVSHR